MVAAIPDEPSAVFAAAVPLGPYATPTIMVRWVTFGPVVDAGAEAGVATDGGDGGGGSPVDSGPKDAGLDGTVAPPSSDDGGAPVFGGEPTTPEASGCGCTTAKSTAGAPWALVSLVVFGLISGQLVRRSTRMRPMDDLRPRRGLFGFRSFLGRVADPGEDEAHP